MSILLRPAFALASGTCKAFTAIFNAYDQLGFFVMRAMADPGFMAAQPERYSSSTLRSGARLYNWAKIQGQNSIVDTIDDNQMRHDFAPKPGTGTIVIRSAEAVAIHVLPKLSGSALMGLGAASVCAAFCLFANGGIDTVTNMISTWMGSTPNSSVRMAPKALN